MKQNGRNGVPLRRLRDTESGMAAVEFALVAPVLFMMIFAVVVYSLYFSAFLGVRQAAAEGARAAMAGMSFSERSSLAKARATTVLSGYGALIGVPVTADNTTAERQDAGLLKITVSYDISGSSIMKYGSLLPMPASLIKSEVIVANGSY
jgi:Flp pilus assembly protein TadG